MSADTAPAAMPGDEEIARLVADVMSRDNHALALHTARKIKALFAPILAEKESLRRELHSLAVALHRKHYWHVKQWQPFDDALGLATQIDNMTAGLVPESRALAAEAALAAERERIATNLDAQADALWERCETKRSNPPSVDEQADAAQAFALQKAAAAIRAQGE